MRKNLSKVVSMVLTVFFLFSIIPMTPVFAAPGGYDTPAYSESFETGWPVDTAFELGTDGAALYEGSVWTVDATLKAIHNTVISVVKNGTEGNVLSLRKTSYTNADGESYGTSDVDRHFIMKEQTLDSATEMAIISFRARRMYDTTNHFDFYISGNNFRIDWKNSRIISGLSIAKGTSFLKTEGAIDNTPKEWNQFDFVFDYRSDKLDVYVNEVKMTPNVSDGKDYIYISDTESAETAAAFSGIGVGIRHNSQSALNAEASVQFDDLYVRELTTAQIEEFKATAWKEVTDAVETRFASLDGKQLDTDVTSIADVLSNGEELQSVLDSAGAEVKWSSDSDFISVAEDNFGAVTHPTESQGEKAVKLTANVTDGTNSYNKSYNVIVLPTSIRDAIDAYFGILDGAKLDEQVTSIEELLSVDDELQATFDELGVQKLEWSSDNAAISLPDGAITHPVDDANAVDVTLTATATDSNGTIKRSYKVTVLPADINIYNDFETYAGESDYLSTKLWKIDDSNITAAIIPEEGNEGNNVVNIKTSVDATEYDMTKGFCWAIGSNSVGGGTSGLSEISFRINRENEAAKNINLYLQSNTSGRVMAVNFDLITGRVTFPAVNSSVPVPAYPTGSVIYSPNLKNMRVGDWADIKLIIPYLQHNVSNRGVMIYVDDEPCLYENNATAIHYYKNDDSKTLTVSVVKDQPMLAQMVDTNIWASNYIRKMTFSMNPAFNAPVENEAASFSMDDVMIKGSLQNSAYNRNCKAIMNVLEPMWNSYSATIASPVIINTSHELATEISPAKSVSWTADITGVVQNNKIILPDVDGLTQITLTATVVSENADNLQEAAMTRTWTVKVAPKLMAKVTDATVESGMLTSITMNNLCALPEGSKLLIGVYDSATSLYKDFKLIDVTDEDIITLDTPLAVGANDTVKAFVWNINTITPMAVLFSK